MVLIIFNWNQVPRRMLRMKYEFTFVIMLLHPIFSSLERPWAAHQWETFEQDIGDEMGETVGTGGTTWKWEVAIEGFLDTCPFWGTDSREFLLPCLLPHLDPGLEMSRLLERELVRLRVVDVAVRIAMIVWFLLGPSRILPRGIFSASLLLKGKKNIVNIWSSLKSEKW